MASELVQQLVGHIKAQIFDKIFAALSLFVRDSWELRQIQALNAARSKYDFVFTLTPTQYTPQGGSAVLGPFLFPQAQQSDQVFSFALIQTDGNSGAARYFTSGNTPSGGTGAAGSEAGFQLQTAGDQVIIRGHENIKGFRLTAEFGDTCYVTASLFQ